MASPRLHWLNAGLMLACCALAFIFPLELMIAAYAILGPAHYLTEIAWLDERRCYATGRWDYLWLALLSLPLYATDLDPRTGLIWLALGSGAVLAFAKRPWIKALAIAALAVGARLAHLSLFWTIMLPTVLHVYLFTGLFILSGALKEKSLPGLISLGVFLACGAAFFLWEPHHGNYALSEALKHRMEYFMIVDGVIVARLGMKGGFSATLAVMGFLGYAYTYHYLNWFSKVEIIRWNQVGRRKLAAVAALYLGILGLFAYDYDLGFAASTWLSLLHVVLEFPLDWRAAAQLAGQAPA